MALTMEKLGEYWTTFFQSILEDSDMRATRITVDEFVTGTSTTPTAFATGISDSVVYDVYISTASGSVGNVYQCTLGGDEATALWQYKFTIPTGADGADGANGSDGTSAYVHYKFSDAVPAQDSDMYSAPTDDTAYFGTYAGTSETAPTNYDAYTWVRIKGQQGDSYTPYYGTAITGTSTTPTVYATGITAAVIGDIYYYNGSDDSYIGNEYICTLGGDADTALWIYLRNVRGAAGAGDVSSVDGITPSSGNVELKAVRYTAQTLTAAQIAQVFANLGLGDAAEKTVGTAAGNLVVLVTGGKLPSSVIPSYAMSELAGTVTSYADLITLSDAETGDYAIVSGDATPANDGTYILDGTYSTLTDWVHISTTGEVSSVNGQTGVIVLTYSDIGAASAAQGALATTINGMIGANSGLATLDSNGKVTAAQASAAITTYTASHTLALSDAGKFLKENSSGDITVTIPLYASVAFPVGTEIEVCRYGSGDVTIAAASGVTLNSADSAVDIGAQYASVALKCIAQDEWLLTGYLA